MSNYEPCGCCGDERGVRFPIPGKEFDSVLCGRCVRSAVAAHAALGSAEWAATRRAWEAQHTAEKTVVGPEGKL